MDEAEMNTTDLDEPKISLNDISFKKKFGCIQNGQKHWKVGKLEEKVCWLKQDPGIEKQSDLAGTVL